MYVHKVTSWLSVCFDAYQNQLRYAQKYKDKNLTQNWYKRSCKIRITMLNSLVHIWKFVITHWEAVLSLIS
jgi:hypothetical protein